ncbi:MAG: ribonuclease III [Planctomycetes bacterium]|nr:ribonuclease III [Planctomycetota bacterium]
MTKRRDDGKGHPPASGDAVPEATLAAIEQALGHRFRDRAILVTALTHPSLIDVTKVSYERLEFLGDAVLGLVVAEHLYRLFPDASEGELTRIKSSVVSRTALSHLGKRLRLIEHLRMAKGMHQQGPIPRSVQANAAEALIGALYCDAGIEPARTFVLEQLGSLIRRSSSSKRPATNHKSLLQLHTQELGLGTPTYEVLTTHGPDHERTFEVRALLGKRAFPSASGASKKKAEQRAAKNALREMKAEVAPEDGDDRDDEVSAARARARRNV